MLDRLSNAPYTATTFPSAQAILHIPYFLMDHYVTQQWSTNFVTRNLYSIILVSILEHLLVSYQTSRLGSIIHIIYYIPCSRVNSFDWSRTLY